MGKLYDRDYQFRDTTTGAVLASGSLSFLEPGTSTGKTVYSDAALTTSLGTTVSLNALGRPESAGSPVDIYGSNLYDVAIISSLAVTVLTVENKDADSFNDSAISEIVTNVAALKAVTGMTDGEARTTLGYYTAGDGGGTTYYWDDDNTTTANDGTYIAADQGGDGRWVYAGDHDNVSILLFGAKGDGITEQQTIFQTAIDAFGQDGGILRVPPGDYIIGANVLVSAPDISIVGDGYSSKLVTKAATDITTLAIEDDNFNIDGIFFDGAFVEGTYEPSTTRNHILLQTNGSDTKNININNCDFHDHPGRAISASGDPVAGYTVDNVTITNCRFFNNPRTGILLFKGCDNWLINSCRFEDNGISIGGDDATASDVSSATTAPNKNVIIANCNFINSGGARGSYVGAGEAVGVGVSGGQRWTIMGCTFDTAGQNGGEAAQYHILFNDGQAFYNLTSDVSIFGNNFTQGTNPSIQLTAVKRGVIAANTFFDNYIRASDPGGDKPEILIQDNTDTTPLGCDYISITGNTFMTSAATSRTNAAVHVLGATATNIESTGNAFQRDANGIYTIQPFVIDTFTATDAASRNVNLRDHSIPVRMIVADDAVNSNFIWSEYDNIWINIWTDTGSDYGQAYVRFKGGAGAAITEISGSTSFAVGTSSGAPSAGAGVDTEFTLYADTSDALLWVSNRLGSQVEFYVSFWGAN